MRDRRSRILKRRVYGESEWLSPLQVTVCPIWQGQVQAREDWRKERILTQALCRKDADFEEMVGNGPFVGI